MTFHQSYKYCQVLLVVAVEVSVFVLHLCQIVSARHVYRTLFSTCHINCLFSSFRPSSVNSDVCNSAIWNRLSSFYDTAGFIKIPPLFTLICFDTRSGVDLYKQMTKPGLNSPACHVLSRKVGGLDTGFIIMRRIERSICKDIFGKQNNQRTSS